MSQMTNWDSANARFYLITASLGAVAVAVFAVAPDVAVGLSGLTLAAMVLGRTWIWRFCLAGSLLISFVNSETLTKVAGQVPWFELQAGLLVLAGVTTWQAKTRSRDSEGARNLRSAIGCFLMLAVLSTVSAFWSLGPLQSLQQGMTLAAMAVFVGLTSSRRWTSVRVLQADLWTLLTTITAFQCAGLLVALGGVGTAFLYGQRYQGLTVNPNYAGMLSALALTLIPHLWLTSGRLGRWFAGAAVFPLAGALLWSDSRGSMLGVVAAGLVVFGMRVSRRHRLIAMSAFVAIAGVAVAVRPTLPGELLNTLLRTQDGVAEADFTSGRSAIWQDLLPIWTDSPIAGIGYRSIQLVTERSLTAHNIYLSFLVETGLIGFALLAVLFTLLLRMAFRNMAAPQLVACVVCISAIELTEASIIGISNPTAVTSWLLMFAAPAWAAATQGSGPSPSRSVDESGMAQRSTAMARL